MSLPLGHHFVPRGEYHGAPADGVGGCSVPPPPTTNPQGERHHRLDCGKPWHQHYDVEDIRPILEASLLGNPGSFQVVDLTADPEWVLAKDVEQEVLTAIWGDVDSQVGVDVSSYLNGASRALLTLRKVMTGGGA